MADRVTHLLDDDDDDYSSRREGSRLCKICDQIGTSDARWLINKENKGELRIGIYVHHRDLHSLKSSALNECRLCQLILSTVVNSDDARKAEMISGENFQDSELVLETRKSLSGRKRRFQEHPHEVSSLLPYFLPEALGNLEATQGLHRLSELCGKGRVLLVGEDWLNVFPSDLVAVVLNPFGAFETRDAHTPFVMGLPFELAIDHGMRNVLARQ